ncbi:hypothetical protein DID88_003368 [Monilinia fructigena]|uniref:NAD-dependent epimerase/dehydratase domain-containing protein n=1 Tax=Monilinia fructigena TaxID=38457 RepID=A0A395IUA2_9HELO|nr:hypothetical protein DID88_003368 [Monilinia fructigena]
MGSKIFITGGTGYIGGSVLDTIAKAHPEYEISALLRSIPSNFASLYPKIKIVKGDYDSVDIISAAASEADVVIHNGNSDHEASMKAIIHGITSNPAPNRPTYLLYLSGTGILSDFRTSRTPGTLNPKIWSDIEDLPSILNRPEGELHQNVEAILHAATAKYSTNVLRAAVMCPPDIYGQGFGPGKKNTIFFSAYVKEIHNLGLGKAFYVGEGENMKSWVHIGDLMRVYRGLIEKAVDGGGNADWGKEGYYFASTQEASQKDIAVATGKILAKNGILKSADTVSISTENLKEVDAMLSDWGIPKLGRYLFASNSRTRADRAKKVLRYKGEEKEILEYLEEELVGYSTE